MGVAELLLKRKQELANKNQIEGFRYLEQYAAAEHTVLLPSGIVYEILEQGDGDFPVLTDTIRCHYHGTNLQGEVFDSSVVRGKEVEFALTKLIRAWQEVVPLMAVGTKFRMAVPSEMAYRDQQLTKEIGPNSTLIFEVEVLGICSVKTVNQ